MAENLNTSSDKVQVGSVEIVFGTVKAMSEDGSERLLSAGEPIYANEQVITENDGSLSILFNDGTILDIPRSASVAVTEDLYQGADPEIISEVADEVETIQEALTENADILENLGKFAER